MSNTHDRGLMHQGMFSASLVLASGENLEDVLIRMWDRISALDAPRHSFTMDAVIV